MSGGRGIRGGIKGTIGGGIDKRGGGKSGGGWTKGLGSGKG